MYMESHFNIMKSYFVDESDMLDCNLKCECMVPRMQTTWNRAWASVIGSCLLNAIVVMLITN